MFAQLFKKAIYSLLAIALPGAVLVSAQTPPERQTNVVDRYVSRLSGMTADRSVELALANNGELQALRKEVDAARALLKQAGLRPNPTATLTGAKQIGGMDNNAMAEVMLPLEIGGRRAARIAIAQKELEIRDYGLANQERLLAAEVRLKYGEAIAAIRKLDIIEQSLAAARNGLELVSARVSEGRIAPLEQNILLVEVNRLQATREASESKVETALFELRNMIGMKPGDMLRLSGDLGGLDASPIAGFDTADDALRRRPDLQGARAVEQLASARIAQAKSESRLDASLTAGYQRMNSSFPVSGFDQQGVLRPVQDIFQFFTFGVQIDLPVRNRNQGAVEAATFDREAARRRVEFGELTIRREVASAAAASARASRVLAIFQNGVRDRAKSNLQVIWQTYELGSRSLLDYIAEERRLLDLENELIDSQLTAYSAHVELMRAANLPELK